MSLAADLRTAGAALVLEPGQSGYDDAVSGFDTGTPMAPAVVVDAQSAADVAATVAVAAQHAQVVTVLGAGHGRLHDLDGGLAITLRGLDTVEVDPTARTARVGAGCTWDPVLVAATPHGLAPVCGSAPGVGIAGYLLGGGLGPLASELGFSSDYVRSVDVVTPADGPLTVTAESDPDLFRALRGGKGGFGVVTSLTIGLPALTDLIGGGIYFAATDVSAVLHAYAEWAPALPQSCTTSVALLRLPTSPALPEQIRGQHVVHVRFASLDSAAAADTLLADLRAVARPLLDTVAVLPYAKLGSIHGDPTAPMPVANGAAALTTLDAATVDAVLAAEDLTADLPLSSVEIRTLGATTRVTPSGGDAVGGRGTAHLLNVYAAPVPTLSDGQRLDAIRSVLASVEPWKAPVNLVNFVGRANDSDAVVRSWSPEQNDWLDAERTRRDPDGLFPFARHASAATGAPGDPS
jgi:FAD/FMN-containing dehydrogenase